MSENRQEILIRQLFAQARSSRDPVSNVDRLGKQGTNGFYVQETVASNT